MYSSAIVVTVVLLLVLPLWPWSKGWTWAPTGMIGVIGAIVWAVTIVEASSA